MKSGLLYMKILNESLLRNISKPFIFSFSASGVDHLHREYITPLGGGLSQGSCLQGVLPSGQPLQSLVPAEVHGSGYSSSQAPRGIIQDLLSYITVIFSLTPCSCGPSNPNKPSEFKFQLRVYFLVGLCP